MSPLSPDLLATSMSPQFRFSDSESGFQCSQVPREALVNDSTSSKAVADQFYW